MRTATDRAIMFSSDAVNVKQSSDGSELTVRLQPAVSVGLQSDATISLESFRFINHVPNVSAALGNNQLRARWGYGSLTHPSGSSGHRDATLTLADGMYTADTLTAAINTQLTAASGWPTHVASSFTKTASASNNDSTSATVITMAAGQGLTQDHVGLVVTSSAGGIANGTTVDAVDDTGLLVTLSAAVSKSQKSATLTFTAHAGVTASGSGTR